MLGALPRQETQTAVMRHLCPVSLQLEPWRNHDAYAVPRHVLLDQFAAAVRAVQDRLQREPDQQEAHECQAHDLLPAREVRGDLDLPKVIKYLALMFRHILPLWW